MRVAIRVDASVQMGAGHFMRCLTLADALKERGAETRFVCRDLPEPFQAMLRDEGHSLELLPAVPGAEPDGEPAHAPWLGVPRAVDARQTAEALGDVRWDWLVVDHYALDASWESALRPAAARILAIDDLADRRHDCDLLLDQNLYRDPEARYRDKAPRGARLLLGPRFALLRASFARLRAHVAPREGAVRRILIFMGGMDAENWTAPAIEAVRKAQLPGVQVDVVIGSQHPARAQLDQRCQELGFTLHVQTPRMADLMAQADLAIGAAGSATWERCCLGLPSLAIAIASNQVELLDNGGASGLLWSSSVTRDSAALLEEELRSLAGNEPLRRHLSLSSMEAVDGRGVQRVLGAMGCLSTEVRPATGDDCQLMLDWRNHPDIRSVSRNADPIDPEAHRRWFASALSDAANVLLIGLQSGHPMGVVRFDLEGDQAEVSVYLKPGAHPPGSGTELMIAGEHWLMEHHPGVRRIVAEVLGHNAASHGLFLGLGYARSSARYVKELT